MRYKNISLDVLNDLSKKVHDDSICHLTARGAVEGFAKPTRHEMHLDGEVKLAARDFLQDDSAIATRLLFRTHYAGGKNVFHEIALEKKPDGIRVHNSWSAQYTHQEWDAQTFDRRVFYGAQGQGLGESEGVQSRKAKQKITDAMDRFAGKSLAKYEFYDFMFKLSKTLYSLDNKSLPDLETVNASLEYCFGVPMDNISVEEVSPDAVDCSIVRYDYFDHSAERHEDDMFYDAKS